MARKIYFLGLFLVSFLVASAQHDHSGHDHSGHDHSDSGHDHSAHDHSAHGHDDHSGCGSHDEGEYDPAATAIHHISDANVFSILDAVRIPLPMILKSDAGWDIFMSSKFHPGHHEDGHESYNGYVMHHGSVYRVADAGFPMTGSVHIDGYTHGTKMVDGKEKEITKVCYGGKHYALDARTTLDGGMLGGGITSFWDFSITKNVVAMLLTCLILFFLLTRAAKRYKSDPMSAPKGIQGIIEPVFLFIRDEVAIPFVGEKHYMRFLPFLMSIFFFILGLNLFGQIPFLGSVNATGNLSITMALAVIAFIVVNINGKADYWKHIFWMPGVPTFVKPILSVVEGMGLFIKPLTLMLRLAGNISAGHIAILSFIGLIFIFGQSGANMMGGSIGTAMAIPLTLFMMAIELVVAFVQAFVFAILTASYIGAAVEEHDDHH